MIKHTTPRFPSASLRRAIERRDGGRCVYCGQTGPMTIDHVRAWAKGGETTADNLVSACAECNETKGVWPVDLFAMLLEREGRGTAGAILRRVYRQLTRPLPEE